MKDAEKPAGEPAPPKPRENRLLIFVAVAFVCLYVILTGYVILSNRTIGSTQLGYSALHNEQLKLLQQETGRLITAVADLRQAQADQGGLAAVRFDGVESQLRQLASELKLVATAQQSLSKSSTTQINALRQQLTDISRVTGTAQAHQDEFADRVVERLTGLEQDVTAATSALAAIRTQQTEATAALTQIQRNTGQLASGSVDDPVRFLNSVIDQSLARGVRWRTLSEADLPAAAQWWQHSQLVIGAANAEPALADKMRQLSAEAARVRQLLVQVVPIAVRQRHTAARTAERKDAALAAWMEAGALLALYPITPETAAAEAVRTMTADHELLRQQIQGRIP